MKIPILGTGLSGLVGSRVVELLSNDFSFEDLSLAEGVDITNLEDVLKRCEESPAKVLIHMAAKTDVDACEDDKILGEEGQAWMVNVVGTQNIVEAASRFNKHVIYISTDFVFDGTKDSYTEDDTPNPVNWYSITKYEGEKLVQTDKITSCIVRLAYPYRAFYQPKLDFVRRIMEKIEKGETISALTDHLFSPTFIDDVAQALKTLLERNLTGIVHVVGSEALTPFEAVNKIMEVFKLKGTVNQVKRLEYFQGRAYRPFKLALKNDRITKLGVKMQKFSDGLIIMKNQLALYK